MEPLLLRAALKRGVLIVAANWPIVAIDFAVESLARVALIVPVVGGALMVTLVAGTDVRTLLADGLFETADVVLGALAGAPAALVAFLAGVMVVAVGGEAIQFVVKAGTLSIVVRADAAAGDAHRLPLSTDSLRRARTFRLEALVEAGRRFASRGIVLSLWLGVVYGVVALFYLTLVSRGLPGGWAPWGAAWSAVVLGATSTAVVIIGAANLAYTLLRVVIITDDCPIRTAIGRLGRFVVEDARQVIGVFAAIGGIELLAGAVALLAAAAVAPIAYVPLIGGVVVAIQVAIWLLRGLLFEALSLVAIAAYQTQYRRFGQSRWPSLTPEAGTDEEPAGWSAEARD